MCYLYKHGRPLFSNWGNLSPEAVSALDLTKYYSDIAKYNPALVPPTPVDPCKCDAFAGTYGCWCRAMMDVLVRQPLTPAETKFGTPGGGYLFPAAAKQLRKQTSALGSLDLDESPGAPPVSKQLAVAMKANHVRVLDLFRECAHAVESRPLATYWATAVGHPLRLASHAPC